MSKVILIRSYRKGDELNLRDLVRDGVFSSMNTAFMSNVFKEFTFQLIILIAAIMFIFFGMPISVCLGVIPAIVLLTYIVTYTVYATKASEVERDVMNANNVYMSNAFSHFWVAEAHDLQPSFKRNPNNDRVYLIMDQNQFRDYAHAVQPLGRRIIGTVGLCKSYHLDKGAWIKRLFVESRYRRNGIGSRLLRTAVDFAKEQGYNCVNLVASEYSEHGRVMCLKSNFELKQMYHKNLLGTFVAVLMYEMTYQIRPSGEFNYNHNHEIYQAARDLLTYKDK